MKFESFIHYMKELQGKVSSNLFGTSFNQASQQQSAFLRQIQKDNKQQKPLTTPLNKLEFVVFDIETTGFFPEQGDKILSLGAIKVKDGMIQEESFYSTIEYLQPLSTEIAQLTNLSHLELAQAPPLREVLVQFFTFVKDATLVAHHANHEKMFMQYFCWKVFKKTFQHRLLDTSFLFKIIEPQSTLVTLDQWCAFHEIPITNRHHALEDAKLAAELWCRYIKLVEQEGIVNLMELYEKLARQR